MLALSIWQTRRTLNWAQRLEAYLPRALRRLHPIRQLAGFLTGLDALRRGDVLLHVLLFSLTAWGSVLVGWSCAARALDIGLSLPDLFFIVAAINLGIAIPMYCLEGNIGATHLRKVGSAFQALSADEAAHPE